jgi:hypothetical protein
VRGLWTIGVKDADVAGPKVPVDEREAAALPA